MGYSTEIQNDNLPVWFELIQSDSREDYINAYRRSLRNPLGLSWNWAAAFIPGWATYRRQITILTLLPQFAVEFLSCIISFLFTIQSRVLDILVSTSLFILLYGVFSNKIYFRILESMHKNGYRPSFYKDTNVKPFKACLISSLINIVLGGILGGLDGFYGLQNKFLTPSVRTLLSILPIFIGALMYFKCFIDDRKSIKRNMNESMIE